MTFWIILALVGGVVLGLVLATLLFMWAFKDAFG